MDPRWQALFYGLAIICWLVGAVKAEHDSRVPVTAFTLACVGWALFAFPFLWDAAAAGW